MRLKFEFLRTDVESCGWPVKMGFECIFLALVCFQLKSSLCSISYSSFITRLICWCFVQRAVACLCWASCHPSSRGRACLLFSTRSHGAGKSLMSSISNLRMISWWKWDSFICLFTYSLVYLFLVGHAFLGGLSSSNCMVWFVVLLGLCNKHRETTSSS